jgi:large subunit ribosomal protein L3
MGTRSATAKNLRVVRSDPDKGVLIVKGAVPGHEGILVTVRKARSAGGRK